MKNDGSLNYQGKITELMGVMLRRRSYRKYSPGAVTDEQAAYIETVIEKAVAEWDCPAAEVRIERGRERFVELAAEAQKGLLGLGNRWLGFCKAEAMILVLADYEAAPVIEDRITAVSQAAMVMQAAVLAAEEVGLATCWMAAISYEHIARKISLAPGKMLIAASPLGLPAARKGLNFDNLANRALSSKRKKLDEIVFTDRLGT